MGNELTKLENTLLDIRITKLQIKKESNRCDQEQKRNYNIVKKYIEKSDFDKARIYGINSLRKQNDSIKYLQLYNRLDMLESQLKSAMISQRITQDMKNFVDVLSKMLQTMDLESINKVIESYDKCNEDIDVRTNYVLNSIEKNSSCNNNVTVTKDVDSLLIQAGEEIGLEISAKLNQLATPSKYPSGGSGYGVFDRDGQLLSRESTL